MYFRKCDFIACYIAIYALDMILFYKFVFFLAFIVAHEPFLCQFFSFAPPICVPKKYVT